MLRITKKGIRRALKAVCYAFGVALLDIHGIAMEHPMIIPNADARLIKGIFELYATDLYSIEGAHKIVQKKGLNIQKTAFSAC